MFKNIVVILIDSLRADGTNYSRDLIYGKGNHDLIKTPNLDNFSKKGTIFTNAYSTNTYTTSAHASFFTGKYPPVHGIRSFFDFEQQLSSKVKTLSENLNSLNYQTFFYSDIPELFSVMDIWRGFKIKTHSKMNWLWNSVEDLKAECNFIFIHTFDVHEPYLLIEDKSENKKINEDYYDTIREIRKKIHLKSKINQKEKPHNAWSEIRNFIEINKIDQEGTLMQYYSKGIEKFDRLRLTKIYQRLNSMGFNDNNTFFVFLSDHGEGKTEFVNNTNFAHSGELTEETTKIFLSTSKLGTPLNENLFSISFLKNLIINNAVNNRSRIDYDYFKFKKLFKEEKYIYAETFIYYLGKNNPHMTDNTTRLVNLNRKFINTESIVYNRGLIGEKSKIIIKNQPEKVDSLYKEKKIAGLIKKSYHFLFGRSPEKNAYNLFLRKLKKNEITKKAFIEILINSKEKKLKPFFSFFQKKYFDENKINTNLMKLRLEIDKILRVSTENKVSFEKIKEYVEF
ncbi:sulfatase-like hydrolase/transferase [Candidatus Roizmanbacteria bacterium]|nr:sulfatase-like hydrolase/transferase [Candidatus Roizmanbacteria bacterium]